MRESRPNASRRGYDNKWTRAREGHLSHEPFCRSCKKAGRTTKATFVDHIVPHRGDMKLFWNTKNWQSICGHCHSSDKQRQEKSGKQEYRGCGADGSPLDPNHHWVMNAKQN